MSDLMPTRGRIMALLSPPSQDVYLDVEDARWIKAEIERLEAALRDILDEVADNMDACAYNIAKAALEGDDE